MFSNRANDRSRRFGSAWILLLAAVAALALMAGCGGGDKATEGEAAQKEVSVIATVGDVEITADYYEGRLAKMKAEELPRKDGQFLDMASEAGKRAFLDVLINKELMVLKAKQLGYDQEAGLQAARKSMIEYAAVQALWWNFTQGLGDTISTEEIQEFYKNMGREYHCEFVVCNFEDRALEARELALSGADWSEVTKRFHDGKPAPNGIYKVAVPFGQYSPSYEEKIFATPKGGVTMPIKTNYGYWVLHVVDIVQKEKPPFEMAEAQILDTIRNRTIGSAKEAERERVFDSYELTINEDALLKVYQAMPPEGLMDPATNKPYTRDQLKPLDVSTGDYGEVLLSYRNADGNLVEITIGDYKDTFDSMNAFQRPRKDEMLGTLRMKVIDEVGKALFNIEARKRGFQEDPMVLKQVDMKLEESLVGRLYQEVVQYDETVTGEELEAFWAEHKDEYKMPESRNGRVVICQDQATAEKAHAALVDGTSWRELLARYGSDAENKKQAGQTGTLRQSDRHPARDTLFSLETIGQISEPFAYSGGRWAVLQLSVITPPRDYEMADVSEALGGRIKKARQDEAFAKLLEEWKTEFGVQVHGEKLADLKSWKELTQQPTPKNLVPRM
ncbi:hypothetical protein CSA17_05470 [bacterium DOLJORAL78_65_58]|nr:MAG: hypothetical protein CSB20_04005 [bacterium DOLZORAL124_64_63]PIE75821.1 MAG: hypothetical protein CSA17_05470 [bacterium DOLJORAL78_65_58]